MNMSDSYTQAARRHYGMPEWDRSDVSEWTAYLDVYGGRAVVKFGYPNGYTAMLYWPGDIVEVGEYGTCREAMTAAYAAAVEDYAGHQRAQDECMVSYMGGEW